MQNGARKFPHCFLIPNYTSCFSSSRSHFFLSSLFLIQLHSIFFIWTIAIVIFSHFYYTKKSRVYFVDDKDFFFLSSFYVLKTGKKIEKSFCVSWHIYYANPRENFISLNGNVTITNYTKNLSSMIFSFVVFEWTLASSPTTKIGKLPKSLTTPRCMFIMHFCVGTNKTYANILFVTFPEARGKSQ